MNRKPLRADLRIEECLDEELRRDVRTARLVDEVNVLPSVERLSLLDVQINAMSSHTPTLTGLRTN